MQEDHKRSHIISISDTYYYNKEEILGQGATGTVYRCYDWNRRDARLAVKRVSKFVNSEADDQRLQRQSKALEAFSKLSLYVIRYHDCIRFGGEVPGFRDIFIITDLYSNESLKDLLVRYPRGMHELEVFAIMFRIVAGMFEAHEKGIIHRDLKPENILMTNDDSIKIADFGYARRFKGRSIYSLQNYTTVGTPVYASPQQFTGGFSGLCDVWSCGMIILELLTGKQYFPEFPKTLNLEKRCLLIREMQFKDFHNKPFELEICYSDFFRKVLPMMLAYNEQDRVSFADLYMYMHKHSTLIKASIMKATNEQLPQLPKTFAERETIEIEEEALYDLDSQPPGWVGLQVSGNLDDFARWLDFRNNRADHYKSIGLKLFDMPIELSTVHKWTLAFLYIGCYHSFLTETIDMIKQLFGRVFTTIRYPGGIIDVKLCNQVYEQKFMLVNATLEKIRLKIQQGNLRKCCKMLVEKDTEEHNWLSKSHPFIYRTAKEMYHWKRCPQPLFLESKLEMFLVKECLPQELGEYTDDKLECFHKLLQVAKLKESIPDKRYHESSWELPPYAGRQNFIQLVRAIKKVR